MNHAVSDDAAVALKGASLAWGALTSATSLSDAPSRRGVPPGASSRTVTERDRSTSPLGASRAGIGHVHAGDTTDPSSSSGNYCHHQPSLAAAASQVHRASPSFIAATLAAGRNASPPRRPKISDAVDSESIPPTGNLISLFEKDRYPASAAGPSTSSSLSLESVGDARSRPDGRAHRAIPSARDVDKTPRSKSKPGPVSSRPPSPSPSSAETEAQRPHVVPFSRLPTPPSTRSAGRISAMPMPKPKLPPHLSLPFPQPSHNPSDDRQYQTQASPMDVKPRRHLVSPSPSRREKPATGRPPRVQPPGDIPAASAPASEVPSQKLPGSDEPASARAPKPNPRGSQRTVMSQRPASRSRHRETSDVHTPAVVQQSKPVVSSRTEFGLPIVSSAPAPAPAPAAAPIPAPVPVPVPAPAPAPPLPPPPRRAHPRQESPAPLPQSVGRVSAASAPASPVLAPQFSRRRLTTTSTSNNNLGLDPLTNAIMASSLAAMKLTPHNTGSSLPPPSLPKRQKSPRLLQTLRQPQGHEADDPERVKIAHRHKLSSNKHAHHEGARKRWRDQVTQRERKRYEAVWASNRGHLLCPCGGNDDRRPPDEGAARVDPECVSNVVVRDIWKRSRLPPDELMEVWELVDRRRDGMLTRQEFVVGMWLIDQRLKGRKIPSRVSGSVWDSVNGVRLPQPGKK